MVSHDAKEQKQRRQRWGWQGSRRVAVRVGAKRSCRLRRPVQSEGTMMSEASERGGGEEGEGGGDI